MSVTIRIEEKAKSAATKLKVHFIKSFEETIGLVTECLSHTAR